MQTSSTSSFSCVYIYIYYIQFLCCAGPSGWQSICIRMYIYMHIVTYNYMYLYMSTHTFTSIYIVYIYMYIFISLHVALRTTGSSVHLTSCPLASFRSYQSCTPPYMRSPVVNNEQWVCPQTWKLEDHVFFFRWTSFGGSFDFHSGPGCLISGRLWFDLSHGLGAEFLLKKCEEISSE